MKIILQEDVDKLGDRLDVVEVADGYARNYLIPQGLAVEATSGALHNLEQQQQAQKYRDQRARKEAEQEAAKVEGYTFMVTKRAGEEGKLFGSVTQTDIADGLEDELDVEIDRRMVRLEEPLKGLGTYPVTIDFGQDVTREIKVEVLGESDE